MKDAAAQLLRALRGTRSQLAFSRRLGYRSAVAADWEAGRRMPTAGEALRAAQRVGVDVVAALQAFQPMTPLPWDPDDPEHVAAWLRALQGNASGRDVADRAGVSRHRVGRWLSGRARPRLHELLLLVEAMTGRASDLVAALVDIDAVPALAGAHHQRRAARRLAFDEPWTAGVLTLVETGQVPVEGAPVWLAGRLGTTTDAAGRALDALVAAGIVVRRRRAWHVDQALTVDVHASPADVAALKGHWLDVARDALGRPRAIHAFNLFSVSSSDLDRIRAAQAAFFREVRGIVAASTPSEVAALLTVQLVPLDADGGPIGTPADAAER